MYRKRGGETGVTLVEVVVALGILSLVLLALGGLMFQVSLSTRRSAALSYRNAAAQGAQGWVLGLPWDSISQSVPNGAVGCITDTTGQLIYSRCSTVVDTAAMKRLVVVLTATGNLTAPPETLLIYRVKPKSASPFSPE